jgi:hypothetical protein
MYYKFQLLVEWEGRKHKNEQTKIRCSSKIGLLDYINMHHESINLVEL